MMPSVVPICPKDFAYIFVAGFHSINLNIGNDIRSNLPVDSLIKDFEIQMEWTWRKKWNGCNGG